MKNGKLSCAFYVSSILTLFKLIGEVHATVEGTVKDLHKSGWQPVKKPRVGSILVWREINLGKGRVHKHIGFYIGGNKAVSNSYKFDYPIKHHWTFNGERKIEAIFWNPRLNR